MGIGIQKSFKIDWLSYIYLFMIVLYAGQSGRLNGLVGFDGSNMIVFFIPIVMTLILINQKHIDWRNKYFTTVLIVMTVWFFLHLIYRGGDLNFSRVFFHYYQFFLCFIIIQVFQDKLFYVYEDIVFKLAVLSLILWGVSLVAPGPMASFFRAVGHETDTTEGSIFVYTMMQLDRVLDYQILRNAGFAWEPGRYACFLCLAIFCNFLINGYRFKKNYRLWVMIAALFSTQSTTGMYTLMVLMLFFVINRNFSGKVFWLALLIPAAIYIVRLDFVTEKTEKRLEWALEAAGTQYGNEEAYALDRIESAVIEWENFKQDPVMGYGEWRHSYFTKNVAQGYYVNNGTMTLLAHYGLFGILWYICIFISSKRIARRFRDRIPIGFFILYLCIGMGYDFNNIVIVMSFAFWGLFISESKYQMRSVFN